MNIGKLKEVDIRSLWKHEQYDFSKWLAGEENIQELGDALNLSLTDVETEKFVGNYRCDILCKDEDKNIEIEVPYEDDEHGFNKWQSINSTPKGVTVLEITKKGRLLQ